MFWAEDRGERILCPKSKILLGCGFVTICYEFFEFFGIFFGKGMSSRTPFVTQAPNKEFHTNEFTVYCLRALLLLVIENFRKVSTFLESPMRV